ncbi:unnamed protein product [Cyprideis torosa]|uniref:Uncharacterized protein n=1 Tax=Cyprideis torosa TaxID=163714 RepID=A0A7R8W4A7_9CRUS|nr:unnamed protein product [Cyprideis torosa]CAG0880429.1 unnamed protein product [Cyprideis torosa]
MKEQSDCVAVIGNVVINSGDGQPQFIRTKDLNKALALPIPKDLDPVVLINPCAPIGGECSFWAGPRLSPSHQTDGEIRTSLPETSSANQEMMNFHSPESAYKLAIIVLASMQYTLCNSCSPQLNADQTLHQRESVVFRESGVDLGMNQRLGDSPQKLIIRPIEVPVYDGPVGTEVPDARPRAFDGPVGTEVPDARPRAFDGPVGTEVPDARPRRSFTSAVSYFVDLICLFSRAECDRIESRRIWSGQKFLMLDRGRSMVQSGQKFLMLDRGRSFTSAVSYFVDLICLFSRAECDRIESRRIWVPAVPPRHPNWLWPPRLVPLLNFLRNSDNTTWALGTGICEAGAADQARQRQP